MPLNIVVCFKQVPDNTKLRVEEVASTLPTDGVTMMANPFDEYALETALRLKEAAGDGSAVTLVTIGHESAKNVLKKAIAVGADGGFILNDADLLAADNSAQSEVLAKAIPQLVEGANVVVCGASALDTAAGQTPGQLAEGLGWASLTNAKAVSLAGDELSVERVSDLGVETHQLPTPAVISMMKCDYELRASNIKGVMKANKTPLPTKSLAELGIDLPSSKVSTVSLTPPPEKGAGQTIDATTDVDGAVAQLVAALKDRQLV